jgi:hypothetical protein
MKKCQLSLSDAWRIAFNTTDACGTAADLGISAILWQGVTYFEGRFDVSTNKLFKYALIQIGEGGLTQAQAGSFLFHVFSLSVFGDFIIGR